MCKGELQAVIGSQLPRFDDEVSKGDFRIIRVEQKHERSGRTVVLIDGESMGETSTDLRKRQFSYLIDGITQVGVKAGFWIMSPREDLGAIIEVKDIGPWGLKKDKLKRVAIRVRFDEKGLIRLNEMWQIFKKRPITNRLMERWQKRMTKEATQYFRQVLPGVLDSVLFEASDSINAEQVNQIRQLQDLILRRAIHIAESQENVQLTSSQLVRATKETLRQSEKLGRNTKALSG
ncbi:MAG: hypothetical protein ACFFDJ_00770 [Candidatus Odinarchaeota archaeon]